MSCGSATGTSSTRCTGRRAKPSGPQAAPRQTDQFRKRRSRSSDHRCIFPEPVVSRHDISRVWIRQAATISSPGQAPERTSSLSPVSGLVETAIAPVRSSSSKVLTNHGPGWQLPPTATKRRARLPSSMARSFISLSDTARTCRRCTCRNRGRSSPTRAPDHSRTIGHPRRVP